MSRIGGMKPTGRIRNDNCGSEAMRRRHWRVSRTAKQKIGKAVGNLVSVSTLQDKVTGRWRTVPERRYASRVVNS